MLREPAKAVQSHYGLCNKLWVQIDIGINHLFRDLKMQLPSLGGLNPGIRRQKLNLRVPIQPSVVRSTSKQTSCPALKERPAPILKVSRIWHHNNNFRKRSGSCFKLILGRDHCESSLRLPALVEACNTYESVDHTREIDYDGFEYIS